MIGYAQDQMPDSAKKLDKFMMPCNWVNVRGPCCYDRCIFIALHAENLKKKTGT